MSYLALEDGTVWPGESVGAEGYETPVVFPGAAGSWAHEAPAPAPPAPLSAKGG